MNDLKAMILSNLHASPSLTRELAREIDRRAVDEFGLSTLVLMENAGRCATDRLCELGVAGSTLIVCGPGNNGGDGLVIARHLDARGHAVQVALCAPVERYQVDAAVNLAIVQKSGLPLAILDGDEPRRSLQPLLAG